MGRWFSKGRESEVRQHGLIDVVDRSRSLRQHKHIDVGQNELETTRLVQPGGGEEKRDYSELVNEILAPRRYQILAASTCGLGIAAGSTTVMAIALALPKVEEEFDASDSERSLVASCIFLGMLIGGLVSGILGDHMYGRKSCIVGFTVVIALFGSLTSIAKTINQVASFRFLAGLGIGGNIPAIFSYMAETTNSSVRGKYMTFVASHWMFGSVIASSVGWIIIPREDSLRVFHLGGWRLYFLICTAPALLCCILVSCVLVESPCYLIEKKKFSQAAFALQRIASFNGEKSSDTKEVLDQLLASQKQVTRQAAEDGGNPYQLMDGLKDCCQSIWRLLKLEESRKTAIVLGIVWFCLSACWYGFMIWLPEFLQAKVSRRYIENSPFLSPLLTFQIAKSFGCLLLIFFSSLPFLQHDNSYLGNVVSLGIVWFCLSACWYGFMIWLPEFLQAKHDNSYLGNVVTSAGDLPGNLISFFLIEKIGRKKSLLISLVASAIFPLVFAAAPKGSDVWAIVGSASFGFVSVGAWNALSILSPELFDTKIRATMHGFLTALGRVGGFLGTYFVGHFQNSGIWLPCIFASSILALACIATLLVPETSGKVLTEFKVGVDDGIQKPNQDSHHP
eukprot:CAMPEP_0197483030 /NCGR_PEP_ID=MMETSP1309-20131121/56672_1 /TAXON_ID=464262 /ORGANISM="Genus nov. species nov., Strain RCC998" /LENGTH=620 /DNA_ID=CAMNT_0043025613 /DNA_START=58 /DNA_END=1921 /DNA_ORIENTATION=-